MIEFFIPHQNEFFLDKDFNHGSNDKTQTLGSDKPFWPNG